MRQSGQFLDNYENKITGHLRPFPSRTILAGKRIPPRAGLNRLRFAGNIYHTPGQGLPTRNAGLAPLRGVYFCTRPVLTSAV